MLGSRTSQHGSLRTGSYRADTVSQTKWHPPPNDRSWFGSDFVILSHSRLLVRGYPTLHAEDGYFAASLFTVVAFLIVAGFPSTFSRSAPENADSLILLRHSQ